MVDLKKGISDIGFLADANDRRDITMIVWTWNDQADEFPAFPPIIVSLSIDTSLRSFNRIRKPKNTIRESFSGT